jgi:hypothetical protein
MLVRSSRTETAAVLYRRRRYRSFVAASVLAFTIACGGVSPGHQGARVPSGDWTVADSAHVRVITTSIHSINPILGWSMGATPELVADSWEDGGGVVHPFRRINGAVLVGDTLLVSDFVSRSVWRFHRDGRSISEPLGTTGDLQGVLGPIHMLPGGSHGRVHIYDEGNRRAFEIDVAEGLVSAGSIPRLGPEQIQVRSGGVVGTQIISAWWSFSDVAASLGGGFTTMELTVGLLDWTSGAVTVVGQFRSGDAWSPAPEQIGGPLPHTMSVRLGAGADRFYIASDTASDIRVFDATGELLKILRLEGVPRRLSPSERDSVITATIQGMPFMAQGVGEWGPRVQTLPPYDRFLVDADGWLWVTIPGFGAGDSSETRWLVFDPEGRARGWMATPSQEEFFVRSIGRNHIVGVARNESGAEMVQVHSLTR